MLGWRDVPIDDRSLGESARSAAPGFEHLFIGRGTAPGGRRNGPTAPRPNRRGATAGADALAFERALYVIRKRVEHEIDRLDLSERWLFYIVSLSSRTLIWKGMLTAAQLAATFPDLIDPELESGLALVHQRFSTNTFPSWPLAHPYRVIAHNGEINTLRGNINWMKAREGLLSSELFGDDLERILPIVRAGGSDTATFDNVLEFLMMSGRSLPHAVLMMIPEPWQNHESMDPARRAFYDYHSSLMEPWDGPASIAFTDGSLIGAVLDRNGLRPSRYYVTKDDLVIMASEVGVLDIAPENIRLKERLHPGKVFLVDTAKGRIVDDEEIKSQLAAARPYQRWLAEHLIDIRELPDAARLPEPDHQTVLQRQQAFGYTEEDLRLLLAPMAQKGEEAVGSMGTDTALAVLSKRPRAAVRLLQAAVRAGHQSAARRDPRGADHLDGVDDRARGQSPRPAPGVVPADRRQVSGAQQRGGGEAPLRRQRHGARPVSSPIAIPATRWRRPARCRAAVARLPHRDAADAVRPGRGRSRARRAMATLCRQASEAVARGYNIIILSDRGINERQRRDSEPARDGRRAPSPRARRNADEVRAGRRGGRRARGAPLRAARRLRRRRGQSVSGVRDARRHDPAGHAAGADAREGGAQLHQGAQQGHPQGDVQDGHLDAAKLLRRADLRGHRSEQGVRRSLLHLDAVAHRGRGHRGDRATRSASATRWRIRHARFRSPRSTAAANTSGGATASSTCSTRRRSSSCSTRRAAASTRSSRSTRGRSTIRPRSSRRCAV